MSSSKTSSNVLLAVAATAIIGASSVGLLLAGPVIHAERKELVLGLLEQKAQIPAGSRDLYYGVLVLLAPRDPNVRLAVARHEQGKGEPEAALRTLERVKGQYAELDTERARVYLELDRKEAALAAAGQAYGNDPSKPSLLLLASALGEQGNAGEAATAFLGSPEAAERVKMLKLSQTARFQLAMVLGLPETAKRLLPESAEGGTAALRGRAFLAAGQGQEGYDRLVTALQEGLALDPANVELRKLLVEARGKNQDAEVQRALLRDLEAGRP